MNNLTFSILLVLVLVALEARANSVESVYRRDSVLPDEMKPMILAKLKEQCPDAIAPGGLSELITTVRADKIDQGLIDYYYVTTFDARYYPDGMHPNHTTITVHSAEYSPSIIEVGPVHCSTS
ncbi:MAG: hypothetical protein NDJ90_14475 [Oligoflexia bacterium]|nr:hypothetical protein [Oligoflexia bacterium]